MDFIHFWLKPRVSAPPKEYQRWSCTAVHLIPERLRRCKKPWGPHGFHFTELLFEGKRRRQGHRQIQNGRVRRHGEFLLRPDVHHTTGCKMLPYSFYANISLLQKSPFFKKSICSVITPPAQNKDIKASSSLHSRMFLVVWLYEPWLANDPKFIHHPFLFLFFFASFFSCIATITLLGHKSQDGWPFIFPPHRRSTFYTLAWSELHLPYIWEESLCPGVSYTIMWRFGWTVGDLVVQWTGKRWPLAESQRVALSAPELMWPLPH